TTHRIERGMTRVVAFGGRTMFNPKVSETVLGALRDQAWPLIRQHYNSNCCIASSRIALDVMRRFDIRGFARPVELNVYNAAFMERYREYGHFPDDEEEARKWEQRGAYRIILGRRGDDEPELTPGHLVVIAEDSWLLDLSLPQTTRPERNIVLQP